MAVSFPISKEKTAADRLNFFRIRNILPPVFQKTEDQPAPCESPILRSLSRQLTSIRKVTARWSYLIFHAGRSLFSNRSEFFAARPKFRSLALYFFLLYLLRRTFGNRLEEDFVEGRWWPIFIVYYGSFLNILSQSSKDNQSRSIVSNRFGRT